MISKDQLTTGFQRAVLREGPRQCHCSTVGGKRVQNPACPAHPASEPLMKALKALLPTEPAPGPAKPAPLASEPAPEKPRRKAAGLAKPRGRKPMNATEAAFALILEARKRAEEIWRYDREGMTLRWPDGMTYTPDFSVLMPGGDEDPAFVHATPDLKPHFRLLLIEVKGAYIEGDALVKFRAARAFWPEFEFSMMQLVKGTWSKIL